MALQSLDGGIYLPSIVYGEPATGTLLIDATGEKAALIFQSPFTGNLRTILFRTATVTTGGTVDVRLETVDATTGDPTGSLAGATTNASVAISAGDDNAIITATLTADAAVTRGTLYAVVIVAGSPGNMNIATFDIDATSTGFPYGDLYTTSWTKQPRRMLCAIADDAGVFRNIPGVTFFWTLTERNYGSGSTPDVWGIRFQVPFPCTVRGFWLTCEVDGDATVKLYDSDGVTVLTSLALDTNQRGSTAEVTHRHVFPADVSLAKDTYYYLGLEPSSATTVGFYTASLPSLASMDAWDGGALVHAASAKDPSGTGSWTHYNNGTDGHLKAWMGVELSAFDDGTGGGGGTTFPVIGGGGVID
jgi:hypothetical protein